MGQFPSKHMKIGCYDEAIFFSSSLRSTSASQAKLACLIVTRFPDHILLSHKNFLIFLFLALLSLLPPKLIEGGVFHSLFPSYPARPRKASKFRVRGS